MARKKKSEKELVEELSALITEYTTTETESWPRIVEGNHSRFTYYEDGSFDHEIDWTKLAEEIHNVLITAEKSNNDGVDSNSENNLATVPPRTKTASKKSRKKGEN